MAQWDLANYMAVVKLGYNDHGPIHAQIVTSAAMQITQLLHHAGVTFDVVESGAGDLDDAHAVVLAGGGEITLDQAIRAYTVGSAYAEFADHVKGTITPGKLADLVMLDRDLYLVLVTSGLYPDDAFSGYGVHRVREKVEEDALELADV